MLNNTEFVDPVVDLSSPFSVDIILSLGFLWLGLRTESLVWSERSYARLDNRIESWVVGVGEINSL